MQTSDRTKQFHVFVTPAELKIVHVVAERSGQSASELVRSLVAREHARLERRAEARTSKR